MNQGTWRLALAQTSAVLGDVEANLQNHLQVMEKAADEGARLVLFPELSLTGYDLRDLVPEVAQVPGESAVLDTLVGATRNGPSACFGFVQESPSHIFYNAAAYAEGGRLVHIHRKVHLPTYGMFDEGRYFGRGRNFRSFETALGRLGMLVCEDFWHLPPAWILAMDGARLILVLSSSPVKTSRPQTHEGHQVSSGHATQSIWTDLARTTSRMYTLHTAFSNAAGSEDQVHYGGGSFACGPTGDLLARAEPLEESLVLAEISEAEIRRARIRWPLLRGEHPEIVLREFERLLLSSRDLEEDGEGPG